MTAMRQPTGLGTAGKALWRKMCEALPPGWQYDEREQALLGAACKQADDLAMLQRAIKRDGAMAVGSKGQPTVHPAIPEARQARVVLSRLLGELSLPVESAERPQTAASRRAQKAANTRWDAKRRKPGVGVG
jgi:P27 family predicted phage terminase small subunit